MNRRQEIALAKLRAQQAAGFKLTAQGNIVTGLNTTTLHGLRRDGFIQCSNVWLRGQVSPDLIIK